MKNGNMARACISVINVLASFLSLVSFVTGASGLVGKTVVGAKAYTLGTVNDVELNTEKWQVTHLTVNLTGEATRELGLKKPLMGSVAVLVPVSAIQAVGDIVTLNKGIKELKEVIEPKK